MRVKKILETFLDFSDPKDIYSQDRDKMIMDKLIEKFVGVCYMSCYIVKVNKIIRRSFIYMKDTLEGDAHISVMFEVDAIVYHTNEIVHGCTIIKKEPNGIVHGKSEYAGIQLSVQSNMAIFKEGDVVPVIVQRVRYNVNQSAVSILAMPFIPITKQTVLYKINGTLLNNQVDELKSLLEEIKLEHETIKKFNKNEKKIYNFFSDMLNPNKSDKLNTFSKKTKLVNMKDILDITSGIIYKSDDICSDTFNYIDDDIKFTSLKLAELDTEIYCDAFVTFIFAFNEDVNAGIIDVPFINTLSTKANDELILALSAVVAAELAVNTVLVTLIKP
jgi:hypothetical protein